MKKFFALVLAIMMVMSLALPAAAAGFTVTLKAPVQNHTYGAYQVFKGDLHDGVLANVDWGTGIDAAKVVDGKTIYEALAELSLVTYTKNPDNTLTANAATTIFAGKNSAADIADVITLANWSHDDAGLKDVAAVFGKYLAAAPEKTSTAGGLDTDNLNYIYTISNLTGGYYLIKDQSVPAGTNDYDHFYTDYILHIVNNVTVSAKGNVPTLNKTVFNASHNQFMEYGDTYVGKQITYRLEASLPSYFAQYDSYWFRMEDKLTSGLDFEAPKRVYVLREGGVIIDVTHLRDTTYDNALDAGKIYEVKVDGRDLFVNFPNAKGTFIGKTEGGTDVEFTVRYSDKFVVEYYAKLNENAVIGGEGNPNTAQLFYNNNPNNTGDGGKTPTDQPSVYTYGLKMLKVDENNNAITLQGAEFQIWLNISGVKNVAMFSAANAAGNRVFQGWIPAADIDTDAEKTATTLKTDTNGNFTVVGLDVGAYRLTETKAPSGYNLLTADINVDIKPTYTAGDLTSLTIEVNGESVAGDVSTGTGVVKVVNQTGATLPSTGGMGTTLFYVFGSIMVMGALVLLITKKRMAAEN